MLTVVSFCILLLSHVWFFATLWTAARQAPLSMGFSKKEYWNALPCRTPGDLYPSVGPLSHEFPALAGRFLPCATWEATFTVVCYKYIYRRYLSTVDFDIHRYSWNQPCTNTKRKNVFKSCKRQVRVQVGRVERRKSVLLIIWSLEASSLTGLVLDFPNSLIWRIIIHKLFLVGEFHPLEFLFNGKYLSL